MTDLRTALDEQAELICPAPDYDDVLRRVHRDRRRLRHGATGTCLVLVALLAVGIVAVSRDHAAPAAPETAPLSVPEIGAVVIGDAPIGSAIERRDLGASDGPWSIVVRAPNGSLGLHSAVVTYPVPAPSALAETLIVGGARAFAGHRMVVFPVGEAWARIRGDLPQPELVRIAESTRAEGGRPIVEPVSGLSVGELQTYRPASDDEVRYGSVELGVGDELGDGMTYTGLLAGAAFEDELFETNGRTGYTVQGRPAVASTVNGGNGTLSWEPAPGLVAYVGYSGTTMNEISIEALSTLAERTTMLTHEAWQALQPQVIDEVDAAEVDAAEVDAAEVGAADPAS